MGWVRSSAVWENLTESSNWTVQSKINKWRKWRTHEKTDNMPVKMSYCLKNKQQQKVTMSTCGIVLYSSTGTRVCSKGQCIWIDVKCRLPKEDFIINSKYNLANTFLLCLTFCLVISPRSVCFWFLIKIHMAISIYSRCIALLCLLQNRLRLEIRIIKAVKKKKMHSQQSLSF